MKRCSHLSYESSHHVTFHQCTVPWNLVPKINILSTVVHKLQLHHERCRGNPSPPHKMLSYCINFLACTRTYVARQTLVGVWRIIRWSVISVSAFFCAQAICSLLEASCSCMASTCRPNYIVKMHPWHLFITAWTSNQEIYAVVHRVCKATFPKGCHSPSCPKMK